MLKHGLNIVIRMI